MGAGLWAHILGKVSQAHIKSDRAHIHTLLYSALQLYSTLLYSAAFCNSTQVYSTLPLGLRPHTTPTTPVPHPQTQHAPLTQGPCASRARALGGNLFWKSVLLNQRYPKI